jgi:AcrR family transcriptional regulator
MTVSSDASRIPQIEPSRVPTERPGQEGGTRATNRVARTQQISGAALRAFLERSIDGVTIDDVTRDAGVAKGSFYRYFESKEALVRSLIGPLGQHALQIMNACADALQNARDRDALFAAFLDMSLQLADLLSNQPDLVMLYLQEGRAPAVGDRRVIRELSDAVGDAAIRITYAARSHGLLRDVPPQVSALTVVGAVERLVFEYLHARLPLAPDVIAQAVVSIILEGVSLGPNDIAAAAASTASSAEPSPVD